MLDAAEEVVLREGIGKLTIDAVAREAALSKSGLLHHFPSKQALIDALVHRKINEWREDTVASYAETPTGPGRAVRAILDTCLSSTEHWTDAMRRSSVVLVAALVHDPKHVEPLREVNREMHKRFALDRLPPGVCDLVHLTVHGIWFDWIFGLSEWTPQRLSAVRGALQRFVAHAGATKAVAIPNPNSKPNSKPVLTKNTRTKPAKTTAITKHAPVPSGRRKKASS